MIMVFLALYAISVVLSLFKVFFYKEGEQNKPQNKKVPNEASNYEIDEEEKIVIALAASAFAGKDKPNSRFHITRITRIK